MENIRAKNITQFLILSFSLILCFSISSTCSGDEVLNPYTVNYDLHPNYQYCNPRSPWNQNMFLSLNQITACFQEYASFGKILRKPDHGFRTDQVIANHGYYFKIYNNITSSDGYIQTMYRITGSPKSPPRKGKPSMLLLHGLGMASDEWFIVGNTSLPFVLADAGFEAWIANLRGSDYSQKHTKLNPDVHFKYWDFTFHEMAVFDIPIYVDLMIQKSGRDKVFIMGHSLGSLISTIALAENFELNDKIHAAFLYGPYVLARHPTLLRTLSLKLYDFPPELMEFVLNNVMLGRFPSRGWKLNRAYASFCSATAFNCAMCGTLMSMAEINHGQLNFSKVPDLLSRVINIVPLKTYLHMIQIAKNCRLERYDYGPARNARVYGRKTPPVYNLSKIRAHQYIYYGETDTFTFPEVFNKQDQRVFANAFPAGTLQAFQPVNATIFDHAAVTNDRNAYKLLYNTIINDMNKYLRN